MQALIYVLRHGLSIKPGCWGNWNNHNISLGTTSSCMTEPSAQRKLFIVWLISREQKAMSSKVPILVFLPHIYSQTADAQYL